MNGSRGNLEEQRPTAVLTICLLGHGTQTVLPCLAGIQLTGGKVRKSGKSIWDFGKLPILTGVLGCVAQLVIFPLLSAKLKPGWGARAEASISSENVFEPIKCSLKDYFQTNGKSVCASKSKF